jgi:hypothetical protein
MSDTKPYKAGYGSDNKHCVEGPGNGFGYSAGTLWPECRLSSKPDAEAAAKLCNEAWRQGYEAARRDIRAAIGAAP